MNQPAWFGYSAFTIYHAIDFTLLHRRIEIIWNIKHIKQLLTPLTKNRLELHRKNQRNTEMYRKVEPLEVGCDDAQSLTWPNITDWVTALISWTVLRVSRTWGPLIVWKGCKRFQCMAETNIYTVRHKKTHQNVFHHTCYKTRPILIKFGMQCLE